ncbi:hypothetical protein D9M71_760150 [compost metagenome]
MELHAFFQVAQKVLGRNHLGNDAPGQRDDLVVQVLHARRLDFVGQFLGMLGAGIQLAVQV